MATAARDLGRHPHGFGCGRRWHYHGIWHVCRAPRGAVACRCPCGAIDGIAVGDTMYLTPKRPRGRPRRAP